MATRQRGGSGGGAATPSQTRTSTGGGVWPVFEDFKPTSEWQQDAESHNLIIYLPGFVKEQIRVSTEGRNIIRVRGERLVGGDKWSRFLEDFQVPENSEMNSVRAMFQGGILKITVPKKRVDKSQEAFPPKITSTDIPKQPTPFKDAGRVVPQDAERKEIISSLKENHVGSERAADDGVIKKTALKEEKKSERRKELPENETATLKADDGAAATSEAKEKDKESKEKQARQSSGADYGTFTIDRYKKAVKGLAELDEERQLMVNMGVGVLVIMALSAYVTYKFASGEDKN